MRLVDAQSVRLRRVLVPERVLLQQQGKGPYQR